MKKEIVEEEDGIVRITTLDERWYSKPDRNEKTGLPDMAVYPSVSWISGSYPKGVRFYKYLADKGWDEAERLRIEAGDRGTKVHCACADLAAGEKVNLDSKFLNSQREEEELSPREYSMVTDFHKFMGKFSPEVIKIEKMGFSEDPKYAGTMDYILRFDKDQKHGRTKVEKGIYIIDLKTSNSIWPSYELQLSAYSHLDSDPKKMKIKKKEWENRKLAFLQVGYNRNKRGWKWTEQEDKFDLFRHAYKIWENENPKAKPKQIEVPKSIKL